MKALIIAAASRAADVIQPKLQAHGAAAQPFH
jgi:hypothetical protein